MRRAFVSTLVELAAQDDRIVLLTGDLGFAALEPFADRFPHRFFNLGVAEQNMLGVATGLAEAGLRPYAYSISTFASMRGYEFLRNGPVLHDLPVRVVGIGEGADYGHNGMTHFALEDVALMRTQPGLAVVAPADDRQVGPIVRSIDRLPGPAYLRLSKSSFEVPRLTPGFDLGRATTIGNGTDVVLVSLGGMASAAVAAADLLCARGLAATVVVVESVSPPPTADLAAALNRTSLAISVEAHYVNGGLGSLVAEVIAEQGLGSKLVRVGAQQSPLGVTGTRDYVHHHLGLDPAQIAQAAINAHPRPLLADQAPDLTAVP